MNVLLNDALLALQKAFPDGFETSVNFDITDLGILTLDSAGARLGKGNSETTLSADLETFAKVMSREEDPATLYFSGRLKVEGDLGIAIRLGQQL